MLNFLSGFLSDLSAAFMFAVLAVLVVGVVVAIDYVWCTFIGWILRIPKS
jgi:hypothetical protein